MALDAFFETQELTLEERFNKIARTIQTCKDCELSKLEYNAEGDRLPGHGSITNRIIFVAQNPSFRKTRFKEPKIFGTWENSNDRLFIENLAAVGIPRKEVFVTNLVKCVSRDNEPPNKKMILACKKYIMQEITFMKPLLIVPIGGIAKQMFKGETGKTTKWMGIDVFSIWHPSYVLRSMLDKVEQDYYNQNYLKQYIELAQNKAFDNIKTEPFKVEEYP